MTEIEKIKRYIGRTDIPFQTCGRYDMARTEWLALRHHSHGAVWDAVALAFDYGRAKGYRAGKKAASGRGEGENCGEKA